METQNKEHNFAQEMYKQKLKYEMPTALEFISRKIMREPILFFAIFIQLPLVLYLGIYCWSLL